MLSFEQFISESFQLLSLKDIHKNQFKSQIDLNFDYELIRREFMVRLNGIFDHINDGNFQVRISKLYNPTPEQISGFLTSINEKTTKMKFELLGKPKSNMYGELVWKIKCKLK